MHKTRLFIIIQVQAHTTEHISQVGVNDMTANGNNTMMNGSVSIQSINTTIQNNATTQIRRATTHAQPQFSIISP